MHLHLKCAEAQINFMTHTEPSKSFSSHQYRTHRSRAKPHMWSHSRRALEDDADSGDMKTTRAVVCVQNDPASVIKREQAISGPSHSDKSRACTDGTTSSTSYSRSAAAPHSPQPSPALAADQVRIHGRSADQHTTHKIHDSELEVVSAEIWRSESAYRAATIGVQQARIAYLSAVNHAHKAGTTLQAAQQTVLARSNTIQHLLPPSPSPQIYDDIALLQTHDGRTDHDTHVEASLSVCSGEQLIHDHQHDTAAATLSLAEYECMQIGGQNTGRPGDQAVSSASRHDSLPPALSASQQRSCTSDLQLSPSHKRKACGSQLYEGGGDKSYQTRMPPDAPPEVVSQQQSYPQAEKTRTMLTERCAARPGQTQQNASSSPTSGMQRRTLPAMHRMSYPCHQQSLEQQKNWLQHQLRQQSRLPTRWQYQGYLRRPVLSSSATTNAAAAVNGQVQLPASQPREQPIQQHVARAGIPIELVFADTDPHLVPERYVLMLNEGQALAARQAAVHQANLLLTRRILAAENLQAHARQATPMPTTPHSNTPQRGQLSASLRRDSSSE